MIGDTVMDSWTVEAVYDEAADSDRDVAVAAVLSQSAGPVVTLDNRHYSEAQARDLIAFLWLALAQCARVVPG